MNELSPTHKPNRLPVFFIALGIFVLVGGGIFLYARYQKSKQPGDRALAVIPGLLRAGDPNFEYYKNRVRISGVKAGLGTNFAKSRIAIISGVITNEGDRKLEALELHIALYDVYDKLSKERSATPLRPGVGIKRPMEPLERRPFTVWIEPIEQFWNPKRLEIEITGLKYQ